MALSILENCEIYRLILLSLLAFSAAPHNANEVEKFGSVLHPSISVEAYRQVYSLSASRLKEPNLCGCIWEKECVYSLHFNTGHLPLQQIFSI